MCWRINLNLLLGANAADDRTLGNKSLRQFLKLLVKS